MLGMNSYRGMSKVIEIEVEESSGRYVASVAQSPPSHRATAPDPMVAIRGALAVSQGHIDEHLGYERDEF